MKKLLIAVLVLTIIQLPICYYLITGSQKKIAYADAIRLFNEYKFKTDLERSSQGTLGRLKNEVDSAAVLYKVNPDDAVVQQVMMSKQQQLRQGYDAINKEINQKVWERLNTKIHDFGKENDIEMLIGANGMGTVLYASESRDVTDALIKYVNESYEKGN
jgi:outer membrane protein